MLKLGGPSQESVTAGLAEARKAEQARVRPSKKVGGDPATVEETGKLMTQKIKSLLSLKHLKLQMKRK